MNNSPLTDAEVDELDSYGILLASLPIPQRAGELWVREIMWGRITPRPMTELERYLSEVHRSPGPSPSSAPPPSKTPFSASSPSGSSSWWGCWSPPQSTMPRSK